MRVKQAILISGCFLIIFLSCKDDAALVGFRKDPKLSTRYVEIPLTRTALLYSPLSTGNTSEETLARILVGKYNDPNFGNIESRGYFTYAPPLQTATPDPAATFVSLELQLKFDYYSYGSVDSTDQTLRVVELLEPISADGQYTNNSTINISSTALGEQVFTPGPYGLKAGWKTNVDADPKNNVSFNVTIPITTGTIGQSLLADLIGDPAIMEDFNAFNDKYPGLALVMAQGDKIFGISPVYTLPLPVTGDSKLTLKYLEGTTPVTVDFPIYYGTNSSGDLNPVISFSTMTVDRSMTALNGIQDFKDFTPSADFHYLQSGTGVLTKFDLGPFYKYFDTLDYAVLNSAEIVLTNTSSKQAPEKIDFRLLDSTNHFRSIYRDTVINGVSGIVNDPYLIKIQSGLFVRGSGTTTTSSSVLTDLTGAVISIDQSTYKVGDALMTEFFQQIFNQRKDPRRVVALAIVPAEGEFEKTFSSLILAPSASLKLYYSKPLVKVQ